MKLKWLVPAALVLTAAIAFAQTNSARLIANLSGAGDDKGKAKWAFKDSRGEFQAELQVEAENLRPNTVYIVTIDNNVPWSTQTNALGAFRIKQMYRSATRPTIVDGSGVSVTDELGNTILLGTMRPQ